MYIGCLIFFKSSLLMQTPRNFHFPNHFASLDNCHNALTFKASIFKQLSLLLFKFKEHCDYWVQPRSLETLFYRYSSIKLYVNVSQNIGTPALNQGSSVVLEHGLSHLTKDLRKSMLNCLMQWPFTEKNFTALSLVEFFLFKLIKYS